MLFLVDTSIYIFRAWQTYPLSLQNRFKETDNAVQGLAETLCSIIETHHPDYMVCAFDECFRQGIRNQISSDYKADRPPAPEALTPQFSRCRQLAEAFGITSLGSDRVEADDIIGQMAELAREQGHPVTIVSGDKDLAQFIRLSDRYWDFGRHAIASYADLYKRLGIRPEQIADWLALCGDKSDNIAGVPGVGPSTAARLLKKWEDIDTLLINLGDVAMMGFRGAPRVSRLLYEHKQSIHHARRLTGLIRDERLPTSMDTLKLELPDTSVFWQSLYDLGFKDNLCDELSARLDKVQTPARHSDTAKP